MLGSKRRISSLCRLEESGAALAELAISIPFFFLLTISTVEYGTKFVNLAWVSEASYLATLTGGEYPKIVGEQKSHARFNALYGLQNSQYAADTDTQQLFDLNYENAAAPPNTVTFSTTGQLRSVMLTSAMASLFNMGMNSGLSVQYVGPHLVQNAGVLNSDLEQFDNDPTGCIYGCDGSCGVPSSTPCGDDPASLDIPAVTMPPPLKVGNPGNGKDPQLGD